MTRDDSPTLPKVPGRGSADSLFGDGGDLFPTLEEPTRRAQAPPGFGKPPGPPTGPSTETMTAGIGGEANQVVAHPSGSYGPLPSEAFERPEPARDESPRPVELSDTGSGAALPPEQFGPSSRGDSQADLGVKFYPPPPPLPQSPLRPKRRVGPVALSDGLQEYLARLLFGRPGPGGMGGVEAGAAAVSPPAMPDLPLRVQSVEYGGPSATGEPGFHILVDDSSLPDALTESLAIWWDRPVMLIGEGGSGKSQACASLAGALARELLGGNKPWQSSFAPYLPRLVAETGRVPYPVVIDFAEIGNQPLYTAQALLNELIRAGKLPRNILDYPHPVLVVADNLDVVVETHGALDPMGLLQQLLTQRSGWRAVIATRPVAREVFYHWAHRYGPFGLLTLLPMRTQLVHTLLECWSAAFAQPLPVQLAELLPQAISSSPRLLHLLLGQWANLESTIAPHLARGGVSGVVRLTLDCLCSTAEERSGAAGIREELQVLADVTGGLYTGTLWLHHVRALIQEGFLRDDLDLLTKTGIIHIRVAKGPPTVAPAGIVGFTHPLLREVLLAEFIVGEIIGNTMANTLSVMVAELEPSDPLAPYDPGQVYRLSEVAYLLLESHSPQHRQQMLTLLEQWLWAQLTAGAAPATPHYPRLLGAAWLVRDGLRRLGTPFTNLSGQLDSHGQAQLRATLAAAGEQALSEALG